MITFQRLRIFIFLILAFSTYAFGADADCPKNPAVCSDKGICYYATKMNNGNKIWDLSGTGKNHVKEAKNRRLTCGIGCSDDPASCEEDQLCSIATTLKDGKVVWQGDFAKDYISEAQNRGVTCGVIEIKKVPKCTNLCDPYWWKDGVTLTDVRANLHWITSSDDLNLLQKYGVRPLHVATQFATPDIIQFLLDAGADPMIKDDLGWTPLHYLAASSPLSLEEQLANAEVLLNNGANILAKDNDGALPFDLLINTELGDEEVAQEGSEIYNLLSPAVKAKEVLMNNEDLQWLCSPLDETPFKLLVSDGKITFTSTDSSDGREPFAFPFTIDPDLGWLVDPESEELSGFDVLSGKLWNEEEFLQCQSDNENITSTASPSNETQENSVDCPSLCDWDWWSNSPSYEDVKGKILEGENIMGAASDLYGGHTPLHLAAAFGAPYMVEFFLSKGIDVEVSDSMGRTPLLYASNWGTVDVMRLLIENGANVNNQSNEYKQTALHWSIESKEKIELLLANGADVMARTVSGETPLHSAAYLGTSEVIEILLANGADILAEDKDGNLPFYQVTENFKIDEGTPAYEALKPEPHIRNLIGTALEGQCKINEDANMGGPQKFNLTVTQEKMIMVAPEGSDEIMEVDYIVDQSTGRLANPESRDNQLSITSGFMFADSEVVGKCDFTQTSSNETSCPDDPKACSDKDLCSYGTKMDTGEKVWDMWGDGKNHSKEAKERGLSCEVGTLVESKDEQAKLLKNADDAYEKGDFGLALQIYKDLAEKGNASAAYTLGKMYYEGSGTLQSYQEAAKWMQLSAEQGFGAASNKLGEMFEFGEGVLQNFQEAIKWYRLGAEQGNASAQYNLGTMYDRGDGVAKNDKEAGWWYQLSAAQGFADAQNELGNMYYYGRGTPQNYQEALKWYRLGAEQGNALAQYNIGWMYDEGEGTPENNQEAAKWYQLSAEQGYGGAQNELGDMFYNGDGVTQNYQEAFKWYRLAADQGNYLAQFSIGIMYDLGMGIEENNQEAARWYELSSEQGFPPAQYLLGDMYYYGLGVPQNYQKALELFKFAAEQAHPDAQNKLGEMFYEGKGIKRNYQKALRWYGAAADQGLAEAQYAVGQIYDNGEDVTQDNYEAFKWYKLSANQGFAKAQNELGNSYYWGSGVEKSHSLAVQYYQLSADQGNDRAQRNLGYMYEKGKGVPKDEIKAFDWYLLSADQGNASAQNTVGNKYYWGKGTEKNHQLAVKYYQLGAEQGNDKAQRNLGYMYAKGKGVDRDEKKAFEWYLLSAEQGNAAAQNTVGDKYYWGKGIEKNHQLAVKYYRLSAEQGNHKGQRNLGYMYSKGKGVTEDDQEAVKWYRLSADKGNAGAQNSLGNMYYRGEGVDKNFQEAIKWYRLSAEKKYHWGLYNLGYMYDTGKGVVENNTEAAKWYKLAAKRGNSKAQYELGLKYKGGSGVNQSDIYSHMWLNISSIRGNKEASKALDKLSLTMTEPDLLKAKQLADKCKKSKYKNCTLED